VFFNPAALTRLEGLQVYAGGSIISPVVSFAGVNPYPGFGVSEEMNAQAFVPPTLYVTYCRDGRWALGGGLNTPFGLGSDWKDPDRFTGRYIVTEDKLETVNGSANLAWQPTPRWGVAAGFDVTFARVELERRNLVPLPGGGGAQVDVAHVRLEGGLDPGYGWNAAVTFTPGSEWKVGAWYRSRVDVEVEGDAEFEQILTGNASLDAAVAASLPPDQGVETEIPMPAMWSLGVAWHPQPGWTVEGDLNWTEWSAFEALPIRFQQTPSANETIPEDYRDGWQARFGLQKQGDPMTWRLGYYYDQAAAPVESQSPILPDADRVGVSGGLGWALGPAKRWRVDVYELMLFVASRGTQGRNRDGYDGVYKSFSNLAGFSVAYRW
jgi:long-chain fatty acid transport protein